MLKLIEIWPFKDMPLHVKHTALVHFNWPVHKMMQNDVGSLFSCSGSYNSMCFTVSCPVHDLWVSLLSCRTLFHFLQFLICFTYLSHKRPLPFTTVYVLHLCVELLLRCIMFCHACLNMLINYFDYNYSTLWEKSRRRIFFFWSFAFWHGLSLT